VTPSSGDGITGLELGIVTSDAARLAEFYVAGLGFEVVAHFTFPQGSVHRLKRGPARCKLFQPADRVLDRPAGDTWHAYAGVTYGALLVDDADAEVARARSAGAAVLQEPISHRPGARYALLADPEGNIWEILEEAPP
jgi:catechol 2,3-dioxygenase-like lactoylglutathione lyase family enzyme